MTKRILAILVIYLAASFAWMVLGGTISARTHAADSVLRGQVASTWGAPQRQIVPSAAVTRLVELAEPDDPGENPLRRGRRETVALPVERSRVTVDLDLEHRQKGLLWYATYGVAFGGRYHFRNSTDHDQVTFTLQFPTKEAIYDDVTFTVNGRTVAFENRGDLLVGTASVAPGAMAELAVGYRSQGLSEWRYGFGGDVAQVRDFELRMTTDFRDVDFPAKTLSPTEKRRSGDGWALTWRYANLLSGYELGMTMPEKLQPGPLAGRISLFAPVSLLFFFLILFLITTVRGIELHPMNYFFLAAAFFSFHLLLAYLVDHVSIHIAFLNASATSVGLVVSYLRLVVGSRFAYREAAVAQIVFLVLFSYAFFFEGLTGLAITIGSVLTLFVAMQMTGRVQWSALFAPRTPPHPPLTPAPLTPAPALVSQPRASR